MSETSASGSDRAHPNTDKSAVAQDQAPSSTVSGSERGRGRGRGRGRTGYYRRGRGASVRAPRAEDGHTQPKVEAGAAENDRPRKQWQERPLKPKLTHFLCIPLGHNPEFQETFSEFTHALLAADPPIPGLDPTIVLAARRMHFTLGVMSLHRPSPTDPDAPIKTLKEATKVLEELKPKLQTMLNGERLTVSLDSMNIMRPRWGDPEQAHVMWVGPADSPGRNRFLEVADVIQKAFNDAGLLEDGDRPLKLHSTILNTIYRKPRPKGPRPPFSFPSILASEATEAILVPSEDSQAEEAEKPKKGPVEVDFGEWDVDELQICEMGSWGEEGEYVAVATCPLV